MRVRTERPLKLSGRWECLADAAAFGLSSRRGIGHRHRLSASLLRRCVGAAGALGRVGRPVRGRCVRLGQGPGAHIRPSTLSCCGTSQTRGDGPRRRRGRGPPVVAAGPAPLRRHCPGSVTGHAHQGRAAPERGAGRGPASRAAGSGARRAGRGVTGGPAESIRRPNGDGSNSSADLGRASSPPVADPQSGWCGDSAVVDQTHLRSLETRSRLAHRVEQKWRVVRIPSTRALASRRSQPGAPVFAGDLPAFQ